MKVRTKSTAVAAAAITAAALAATTGTAHADSLTCRGGTASPSSGAHGWSLSMCINTSTAPNGTLTQDYYWDAWTTASNSTDVRVWYTISCPGRTPGSDSRHVYPPSGHWGAYSSYPHCAFSVHLTESGQDDIDLGTMRL
ncbi:MAG TPA: hypothetical protein VFV01_12680 [Spirillospora sp.]|nr:hypothetical protein [Spirillospora sp.]